MLNNRMRDGMISCAIFLHLSMFLLTWGFDERDLTQYLRQNGTPSNVTYNGKILLYENQFWDPPRIVDGAYNDTKTCNCCTSFIKPAWINIDLHEPQPFHRIEIIGRSDDFSQSLNLQISVDDGISTSGHIQLVPNLTGTFVLNTTDTLKFVRSINLSSYGDPGPYELMTICEIRVLQTVVNITSQSSNYQTCYSLNALNTKTLSGTSDSDLCKACSATDSQDDLNPWWELDFGEIKLIREIKISGRSTASPQSTNLIVFISNITIKGLRDINTKSSCLSYPCTIIFVKPRLARFINVKHDVKNEAVLTLCQVDSYEGDCQNNTFGDQCSRTSQCETKPDVITGFCRECLPGWASDTCEIACSGSFGNKCSHQCHCNNRTEVCDPFNGTCASGCLEGWSGSNCSVDLNILRSGKYNVSVSQSSNYTTCAADRAIDGLLGTLNTTDDVFCSSCSATSDTEAPWWQIQLDRKILGLSIMLTCCKVKTFSCTSAMKHLRRIVMVLSSELYTTQRQMMGKHFLSTKLYFNIYVLDDGMQVT